MLSVSSVSIYGVVRHLSVGSVSPHKVLCKHGCALIDRLFPVCRFDSSCTLNGLLTKGLEQCWQFIIIKGTVNCHGQEVAISLLSILAALNSTFSQILLQIVRGHSVGYQTIFASIFASCRQNLFRFGFVWMSAELNIWNVI